LREGFDFLIYIAIDSREKRLSWVTFRMVNWEELIGEVQFRV